MPHSESAIRNAIGKLKIQKSPSDRTSDIARLQSLLSYPVPEWYKILIQESTIENSCRQMHPPKEDAVFVPHLDSMCEEIESSLGLGKLARRGYFPVGVCAFGTGWMYSVEDNGRVNGRFVRHHDDDSPPIVIADDFVQFLTLTSEN